VIRIAEALRWLDGADGRFDVVLLDPPFGSKLAEKTLNKLFLRDLVNGGGFILCEADRDTAPPQPAEPYHLQKVYTYGAKQLLLYERKNV
jgi:16S rRNA G966 N2-methylase RsmD